MKPIVLLFRQIPLGDLDPLGGDNIALGQAGGAQTKQRHTTAATPQVRKPYPVVGQGLIVAKGLDVDNLTAAPHERNTDAREWRANRSILCLSSDGHQIIPKRFLPVHLVEPFLSDFVALMRAHEPGDVAAEMPALLVEDLLGATGSNHDGLAQI
jgi:hypothetical protein